jgi:thiamine biosynthesis lipoprotein
MVGVGVGCPVWQPLRTIDAARSGIRIEERHRGMRHRGIEAKAVGLIAVFIFFLGGCAGRLSRFEFTRLEMGVKTRVVTYAASKEEAEAGAAAAFGRIAELDAMMSDYRADSELMRLCGRPAGEAVPVSKDLFEVLSTAQRISAASDGAFDVTVGPVVALWREARRTHELPSKEATEEARGRVGWREVVLEPARRTVTLRRPGMRLDLGAIGKGYAAEEGVRVLRAHGQGRCLVALAGDIYAGDPPPGEKGWRVEVIEEAAIPWRTVLLKNEGVSTSGDAEQFVEVGGVRYSHIVDPRTGTATTTRLRATVVARHGAIADGASTAVTILGPTKGAELVCGLGAAMVIQMPDGTVIGDEEAYRVRWAEESESEPAETKPR